MLVVQQVLVLMMVLVPLIVGVVLRVQQRNRPLILLISEFQCMVEREREREEREGGDETRREKVLPSYIACVVWARKYENKYLR